MKTVTARTNEFSVIKELAHSGRLVKIRTVFLWRQWTFGWEFTYVPFIQAFAGILNKSKDFKEINWNIQNSSKKIRLDIANCLK